MTTIDSAVNESQELQIQIKKTEAELHEKEVQTERSVGLDWIDLEKIVNSIQDIKTKLISLRYSKSPVKISQ